jgi:hypothetical protein
MDDTPPEQRTALLPVEKLKQLCIDEHVEYTTFKEFRLKGRAESLKDFLDFCFLEYGEYDKNRIVWITENAFVRLTLDVHLPGDYHDQRFGLTLSTSDGYDYSHDHYLYIHSSTLEGAIAASDFIVGLQDSHFKRIALQYSDRDYDSNRQPPICPLRGRHLDNFVRNANRENILYLMMFTRDQCRTLASSGIRTNIGFCNCRFEDEAMHSWRHPQREKT